MKYQPLMWSFAPVGRNNLTEFRRTDCIVTHITLLSHLLPSILYVLHKYQVDEFKIHLQFNEFERTKAHKYIRLWYVYCTFCILCT